MCAWAFRRRFQRVSLGELEMEHRLTLGLIFCIDDLPALVLGSLS